MDRVAATVLSLLALAGVGGVAFTQLNSFGTGRGSEAGELTGDWTAYLAPEERCPGRRDGGAPAEVQERTMLCLIDWARRRHGGDPLPSAPVLMESAALKASDIAACREFSHGACGKPPDDAFTSVAYGAGATASGVGENLAWGAGPAGSPLDVLNGWLNSPPHRSTLFRADWTEQGVALVVGPAPEGVGEAAIWVSHFGYRR